MVDRTTKLSVFGLSVELAAGEVEKERLMEPSSIDEKARALQEVEVAKAIAWEFDNWRKEYHHPDGMADRNLLLLWLGSNHGAPFVSRNYGIFKALIEILANMGYETLPTPSEAELRNALPESGIFVSNFTGSLENRGGR